MNKEVELEDIIYTAMVYIEEGYTDISELYKILTRVQDLRDPQKELESALYDEINYKE